MSGGRIAPQDLAEHERRVFAIIERLLCASRSPWRWSEICRVLEARVVPEMPPDATEEHMLGVCEEFRALLTPAFHEADSPAAVALEVLESAVREWERIKAEKAEKLRREAEEEEERRRAALIEQRKREERSKAAVEFILSSPDAGQVPFAVLGVDPHLMNTELLKRVKQKLMILTHPDKCTDDALRSKCTEAFKKVNTAFATASQMVKDMSHYKTRGPRSRPPFAEEFESFLGPSPVTSCASTASSPRRNERRGATSGGPSPGQSSQKTPRAPQRMLDAYSGTCFFGGGRHTTTSWGINDSSIKFAKVEVGGGYFPYTGPFLMAIHVHAVPEKEEVGCALLIHIMRPYLRRSGLASPRTTSDRTAAVQSLDPHAEWKGWVDVGIPVVFTDSLYAVAGSVVADDVVVWKVGLQLQQKSGNVSPIKFVEYAVLLSSLPGSGRLNPARKSELVDMLQAHGVRPASSATKAALRADMVAASAAMAEGMTQRV